ncbi:MAG: hypothetical protein H0X51_09185 [Parachlamydiaceae bacterium]|nr:hypothetical protein [Parachlamydiaceae bacterium]
MGAFIGRYQNFDQFEQAAKGFYEQLGKEKKSDSAEESDDLLLALDQWSYLAPVKTRTTSSAAEALLNLYEHNPIFAAATLTSLEALQKEKEFNQAPFSLRLHTFIIRLKDVCRELNAAGVVLKSHVPAMESKEERAHSPT